MQLSLLSIALLASSTFSLSTTQQSGAGPHVGAVLGRISTISFFNGTQNQTTGSVSKRSFGLAQIGGIYQNRHRRTLTAAQEAADIQSAVYAIIVSISNGLSTASSILNGTINVSFARLVFFLFFFCNQPPFELIFFFLVGFIFVFKKLYTNSLIFLSILFSQSNSNQLTSTIPVTNTTTSTGPVDDGDDDDGICVPDTAAYNATHIASATDSSWDSSWDSSTSDSSQPTAVALIAEGRAGSQSASASTPTSTSQVYSNSFATYFTQGGVAGNCGAGKFNIHSNLELFLSSNLYTNSLLYFSYELLVSLDTDLVIAVDSSLYNNGANCGRYIKVTRVSNGAQVTAKVADSCPTCPTSNSLDLSVAAFNKIATEEEGMVAITWQYIS